MRILPEDNPYERYLIKLIVSIDGQIPLDREDQLLIALVLDSEEKIVQFNRWIGSKLDGETLQATAPEIVRAAVKIGRGTPPS